MKSLFFSAIVLLSFFIFSSAANGQETDNIWTTYIDDNLYEISTLKSNCSDLSKGINKEYLFLKITNKSDADIKLSYKIEKWYGGVCSNCDESAENAPYTIELKKGESVNGSCENYRARELAVFSKMTGRAKARKLTSFKIIPLKINDTNIK